MIPILYSANETAFTSGGLGALVDCISCLVTEGLNDTFECEFEYPITGKLYSEIEEGMIIVASHDDVGTAQPFIIYKRTAPINGVVTFVAHHLSYRLSDIVVMPFTASSCSEAITNLVANVVGTLPFTFTTDVVASANIAIEKPMSIRSALLGDGGIVSTYGGELEFDGWSVKLHTARGIDNGVEIRYGKNLSDIKQTIDISFQYNAIVPFWADTSKGTVVTLPERYLSHDDGSGIMKATALDLSDQFEGTPTVTQLRTLAQERFDASEPWTPSESISVSFVQLWQTEEYKQYAALQKVSLGDYVHVYYTALGVIANNQKVVQTVFDTLLDRYNEITLNELQTTLQDLTTDSIQLETNAAMITAINQALSESTLRSGSGTVTLDENGIGNITTLVASGCVPVFGYINGAEAFVAFARTSSGGYKIRCTDSYGVPITGSNTIVVYSYK